MEYPCIVYELSGINTRQADNKKYLKFKRYSITVITRNPDDNLPEAILDHFDNCSFDRQFKTAGLYHNVLTLYY